MRCSLAGGGRRSPLPRPASGDFIGPLTHPGYTAPMLLSLAIHNFATVESLRTEFHPGMSALTGETGAGKSIIVGALGLALGGRADKTVVRLGAKKTEIAAEFDISRNDAASQWLEKNQLEAETPESCLLRRVVGDDGRSRGFVNDTQVTLSSLRRLGELLVDIVGQREHQALLRRGAQLDLLDDFCVERQALENLRALHRQWRDNRQSMERLRGGEDDSRMQLLAYQLDELRGLAATEGEAEALEQEQRRLSGAEEALSTLSSARDEIAGGEQDHASSDALSGVRRVQRSLEALGGDSERITNALEMLESASIQLDEAAADLRAACDDFPIDPQRLAEVDQRLGDLHDMARKHKVRPGELAELTRSLDEQLQRMRGEEEALRHLQENDSRLRREYAAATAEVGEQRRRGAGHLTAAIDRHIAKLGMASADIEIRFESLDSETINGSGLDAVEFLAATNPGQAVGPLSKIASGGELSRISLAIRLATAQTSQTPCLIFDEVDVGIGGGVAAQVGALLRTLGESAQILCITHQPQVASCAHRQYSVSKSSDGANTRTAIRELDAEERVAEVSRMLAGADSTDASLTHARQMLKSATEPAPHSI